MTPQARLGLLVTGLVLAVGGASGYGAYLYGQRTGHEAGFRAGAQQEVESRSKPAVETPAARLAIDPDSVVAGLLARGGGAPSEEFRSSVDEINRTALAELGRVYGLSEAEQRTILAEYDALSEGVVVSYFEGLQELRGDRTSFPSESVITFEAYDVASDFSQLLADRSCLLFNTVMAFSSSTSTEGKLMLKGLCKLVARDLMKPVAEELKASALVRDLNATRFNLEQHTRDSIAELAVAEDHLTTTLDRVFQRKVMERTWFEFQSEATLTIEGTGSIKAGFPLQDYFSVSIDHGRKVITVTLPEPEILSTDVSYRVLNDEDGFFVSVTPEKRTEALADLRRSLQRAAVDRGLLEEAEKQAEKIISVLYSPITYLPDAPYRVEVGFQGRGRVWESGRE